MYHHKQVFPAKDLRAHVLCHRGPGRREPVVTVTLILLIYFVILEGEITIYYIKLMLLLA